jgi:hypothetical protein
MNLDILDASGVSGYNVGPLISGYKATDIAIKTGEV